MEEYWIYKYEKQLHKKLDELLHPMKGKIWRYEKYKKLVYNELLSFLDTLESNITIVLLGRTHLVQDLFEIYLNSHRTNDKLIGDGKIKIG